MRKHLIAKYGVSHLWRMHKVHLEKTSLKMGLFRLVLLQSIEKEGCCRLDKVLRHENIDDL
jgi:hypothetical protein